MEQKILVSIVIEMGTRELTDKIAPESCARHFIEEARSFLTDDKFEILFVGCNIPPMEGLLPNCRLLDICETSYYGWKNEGAKIAKGRYLVFWDSDCRPKKGYLKQAVSILEENPSMSGLTGATQYDGDSFLSRLNTVLSFGYLHLDQENLGRFNPMGHNIVIRKALFPSNPFGPHKARAGGDLHLARAAKSMGKPLQHNRHLQLFHEDMSYSLTALMEQHLREIYIGLLGRPDASRLMKIWTGMRAVPIVSLKRVWRLMKYRKALHFGGLDTILSIPILSFYFLLDFATVSLLSLVPPLMDKWIYFQFQETPKG